MKSSHSRKSSPIPRIRGFQCPSTIIRSCTWNSLFSGESTESLELSHFLSFLLMSSTHIWTHHHPFPADQFCFIPHLRMTPLPDQSPKPGTWESTWTPPPSSTLIQSISESCDLLGVSHLSIYHHYLTSGHWHFLFGWLQWSPSWCLPAPTPISLPQVTC